MNYTTIEPILALADFFDGLKTWSVTTFKESLDNNENIF